MNNFQRLFQDPRKVVLTIVVPIFILHVLPYFLATEHAYIRIHDTLEGEWVWLHTLVTGGFALDYNMEHTIPQVMNGIPRHMYPSGLSINVLLIFLFGTFWGYVASYILLRLIAFIGAYFLLKRYILKGEHHRTWCLLIALIFSLIPFFTALGLTVAGQPLLVLAFLNIIYKRTAVWEYAFIFAYPFYSSIVWAAPFVGLMILLILARHVLSGNQVPWKALSMLLLMCMLYIAANVHLLYSIALADAVSHRVEYNPSLEWNASIGACLLETVYIFFLGHYHVGMFFTVPVLVLGVARREIAVIRYLLVLIGAIALVNGFYVYLVPILEAVHPLLISFVIKRVNVLLPFLWIVVLAYSLKGVSLSTDYSRFATFVLFNMVVIGLFANDELLHNYRNLCGFQKKPGFTQFFSEEQFEAIDQKIGREKWTYRVASLGLNPTIAQYNGFYTIDGLQSIYPLEHKQAVMRVMEAELMEDRELYNYFTAWGNRCYLFSSELGFSDAAFMVSARENRSIQSWDIDVDELEQLNVEFVFSAVEVMNAETINLRLIDVFENERWYWKIHLYHVD